MKQVKKLILAGVLVCTLGIGVQAGDMGSPGIRCLDPGDMGSPGVTLPPCEPPKPPNAPPADPEKGIDDISDQLLQELLFGLIRLIY